MSIELSANAQAILLLTAPLGAGQPGDAPLLSLGEYNRLARCLRDIQRQPLHLLEPDAVELLASCQGVAEGARLQRLLGRGFLLSQAVERWQERGIWLVSRADDDYPARLRARLREQSPPIIYGCGERSLLDMEGETGGLAIVGSRQINEALAQYALSAGELAAAAHVTVVSGGARGIDQYAMRGALEAGGCVVGVLADSLERAVLQREHRDLLMDGRLVLISACDPAAGFNVGLAMQRNKYIYALAQAALVVSSDLDKGGTWAGAVEQLDKLHLAVIYVRSSGEAQAGLEALKLKGALPWPDPATAEELAAILAAAGPGEGTEPSLQMSLFPSEDGPAP